MFYYGVKRGCCYPLSRLHKRKGGVSMFFINIAALVMQAFQLGLQVAEFLKNRNAQSTSRYPKGRGWSKWFTLNSVCVH